MTLSELQTRLLERLGENTAGPIYYTAADATAWLNAVQRMFVLLTLCLETTGVLTLDGGAFYSLLGTFPDFILPLRVRNNAGEKLTPARLSDLAMIDANWSASVGPLQRYALLGFDLLATWQQPPPAYSLSITYARGPALLAAGGDVPEIPAEYHPALIDGSIPLMRAREGGQEWQKVLPLWDRFVDAATKLADYVRARNKEQGYDYYPVELRRIDRSKLLRKES